MPPKREDRRPDVAAALGRAQALAPDPLDPVACDDVCNQLVALPTEKRRLFAANSSRAGRIQVVRRLLERAYGLRHDEPREGLQIARAAREVADSLRLGPAYEGLVADAQAAAWAHVGNIERIVGNLAAAEEAFGRADALAEEGTGEPLLRAEQFSLKASLRRSQRRFDEALELLDQAAELYEALDEGHLAGHARINQGVTHSYAGRSSSAIWYTYVGANQIDAGRDLELTLSACHNLVGYLAEAGEAEVALEAMEKAQFLYDAAGGRVVRLRARWLRGRLHASLGHWEKAFLHLDGARRGYIDREMSYNAALVALDLSAVYLHRLRYDKVEELVGEMYPVFVAHDIPREASMALLLFVKAVQERTVTINLCSELERALERFRDHGPAPPAGPARRGR